jgi:hypothetical protein
LKIAQAKRLVSKNIEMMTIEQLQRYKVKVIDAWRESRADYGIAQAVRDGFYLQTGEDASEYTPKDLWLTQNLTRRLDAIDRREHEMFRQR